MKPKQPSFYSQNIRYSSFSNVCNLRSLPYIFSLSRRWPIERIDTHRCEYCRNHLDSPSERPLQSMGGDTFGNRAPGMIYGRGSWSIASCTVSGSEILPPRAPEPHGEDEHGLTRFDFSLWKVMVAHIKAFVRSPGYSTCCKHTMLWYISHSASSLCILSGITVLSGHNICHVTTDTHWSPHSVSGLALKQFTDIERPITSYLLCKFERYQFYYWLVKAFIPGVYQAALLHLANPEDSCSLEIVGSSYSRWSTGTTSRTRRSAKAPKHELHST